MRLVIARMAQETNTFSPLRTALEDFGRDQSEPLDPDMVHDPLQGMDRPAQAKAG